MRFVGIDIASETHVVAIVDDRSEILVKATPFKEDSEGYGRLSELLGSATDTLVAMEATGHYWRNLFAALAGRGFAIALLNPLRTSRFAGEDLERAKTDAIDALGIARFAAQKRPVATPLPETATDELRELVRHKDRLVQALSDSVRQLHRLVDLGFPELTRHIKSLDGALATTVLRRFPTAEAFKGASRKSVANLRYGKGRRVGDELAGAILKDARISVGAHHGHAYRLQIEHACEDIDTLRARIEKMDRDIERRLDDHQVGSLLTSIDGIGPQTAARLIGELGDIAKFQSARALAAYVGVAPATRQSGKRKNLRAPITPIGHARLRRALWMPTLSAVRANPWLRPFYERLRASGKPHKVALIAAMRKLLAAIYFVAKNNKPFVPALEEVTV